MGNGKRADIYLEVRKRRGHIFFESNKCPWNSYIRVDSYRKEEKSYSLQLKGLRPLLIVFKTMSVSQQKLFNYVSVSEEI